MTSLSIMVYMLVMRLHSQYREVWVFFALQITQACNIH